MASSFFFAHIKHANRYRHVLRNCASGKCSKRIISRVRYINAVFTNITRTSGVQLGGQKSNTKVTRSPANDRYEICHFLRTTLSGFFTYPTCKLLRQNSSCASNIPCTFCNFWNVAWEPHRANELTKKYRIRLSKTYWTIFNDILTTGNIWSIPKKWPLITFTCDVIMVPVVTRAPNITNISCWKIAPKPLVYIDPRIHLNYYTFLPGKTI